MRIRPISLSLAAVVASLGIGLAQQPQPPTNQTPQQPSDVGIVISGDPGSPPRIAVPDFLALSNDRETQDVAQVDPALPRDFVRAHKKSDPAVTPILETSE